MFSQQTIHAMNNPTATLETWECTGCYLPQVAGSPFYLGGPDLGPSMRTMLGDGQVIKSDD
jgi:hypothetical protein